MEPSVAIGNNVGSSGEKHQVGINFIHGWHSSYHVWCFDLVIRIENYLSKKK